MQKKLLEVKNLELKDFVALFPFSIAAARTLPHEKISEWINESNENYLIFSL